MIKALIAGDVYLSKSLKTKPQRNHFFEDDEDIDIFICNLEAPLLSNETRYGRRALLTTEPDLLGCLKVAKANILVLANNHMNDNGESGLLKTVKACKKLGFETVGAGCNIEEARRPVILEIKNRKIAILAYAETETYVGSIAASDNTAGIAPLDIPMIVEDISIIKDKVDDLWIFLHWGREYHRYPDIYQKRIADILVSAGSDLIVGHHPHIIQGMEDINGKPVFYSLGNFIFPPIDLSDGCKLYWDRKSRKSLVLSSQYVNGKWEYNYRYYNIDKSGRPNEIITRNCILKKRSKLFKSKYYNGISIFFSYLDTLRVNLNRFTNMGKLYKDILRYLSRFYGKK